VLFQCHSPFGSFLFNGTASSSEFTAFSSKVVTVNAMKAYGGEEVYLHQFLISTLNEVQWPTSRLGRIIPGKEALHPLSKKMGGAQSRFGRCKEQKNVLTVPGFEPLIFQPVFLTCLAVRRKNRENYS
jgi:hypothetical protein